MWSNNIDEDSAATIIPVMPYNAIMAGVSGFY
jgi:hypothetical protein